MNRLQHRIAKLLLLSLPAFAASACSSNDEQSDAAVRIVLEAQQAAWNRGDIDEFMDGYERGETTTFVSGDQLIRGWRTVLERYKQRYGSREQMGMLEFSELEIKQLSPDYILADGRWRLMGLKDTPHGRFTLLFHRTADAWRIVHDTTTSGAP
jgi:ketosteroid isomerase-like protein